MSSAPPPATRPPSVSAPATPAPPGPFARVSRALVSAPIIIYRKAISPAFPRRCKYEPTCSRYALDAIGRYGILKGAVLALWRVLRCNPWSDGGYDPVEAQRLFKARVHTGG